MNHRVHASSSELLGHLIKLARQEYKLELGNALWHIAFLEVFDKESLFFVNKAYVISCLRYLFGQMIQYQRQCIEVPLAEFKETVAYYADLDDAEGIPVRYRVGLFHGYEDTSTPEDKKPKRSFRGPDGEVMRFPPEGLNWFKVEQDGREKFIAAKNDEYKANMKSVWDTVHDLHERILGDKKFWRDVSRDLSICISAKDNAALRFERSRWNKIIVGRKGIDEKKIEPYRIRLANKIRTELKKNKFNPELEGCCDSIRNKGVPISWPKPRPPGMERDYVIDRCLQKLNWEIIKKQT